MAEEDSVGRGWRGPEGAESGARAAAACAGARASSSPVAGRRKSSSGDREHAVSAECVGSPSAPARRRTAEEAGAGRRSRSGSPARRAAPANWPPDDFLGAGFVAGSTFAQDQDVLLRLVRSTAPSLFPATDKVFSGFQLFPAMDAVRTQLRFFMPESLQPAKVRHFCCLCLCLSLLRHALQ